MNRKLTLGGFAGAAAGVVLCLAPCADAQVRLDEDPATARMTALGGRAEAAGTSSSAMFANPAMLSATRGYHTDLFGVWDPTVARWALGSVVVDSTRQTVSAGLSYLYTNVSPSGTTPGRDSHDTRMNVAIAISSWIGAGLSLRYLNASGGPPALNGGSLTVGPYDGFTFDAGLFVRPAQFLVLSASGRNINNQSNTNTPIGLGFGAAATPFAGLTIVADALFDFRSTSSTRGRYSGGIEYLLMARIPLRVGYAYDDVRGTQAITAGVGYVDANIGVDLSLREGFSPQAQTTLMLSLRYFYTGAL